MRQADFYWRTSTGVIALALTIMPAAARSQVVAQREHQLSPPK